MTQKQQSLSSIFPKRDERICILGATGSGKTNFLVYLLSYLAKSQTTRIDILDTKVEPKFEQLPFSEVVENFDDLSKCEALVRIYRPNGKEVNDLELLDQYLQWRYENAPNLTVIDEIGSLGINTKPRMGLQNLLTRGRSRNAALWICSQRPAWVNNFIFTESKRFYVFYLNDEKDRKRVTQFTTPAMEKPAKIEYGFKYYKVGTRSVTEFKGVPNMDN